jgi:spermidine synthase
MISHIAALTHKHPKKAVVIGGGDGGTVRELLKHPTIDEITLCEIDKMVVDASKEFFPNIACGLSDPRVTENIGDGLAYMRDHQENSLDLVVVDSTDPIGPGLSLFTEEFYQSVAKALKPDGIMVAQSESPWYGTDVHGQIQSNISGGFAFKKTFMGIIPTYPRGAWTWTMASAQELNPQNFDRQRFAAFSKDLKYLNEELLTGCFALPNFFKKTLGLI